MHLTTEKEIRLYRKYLVPSLGSAMVMSIYVMADAIAIGKGVGPLGLSALNITTPLLCLLMSTGLLFGIGGAALMSLKFGENDEEGGRQFFTASFIGIAILGALYWLLYSVFLDELVTLLGATPAIYDYVKEYMFYINLFLPIVLISNFIAGFVRNDNDPNRAMLGVIIGGCVNIALDYILVFPLQMGMAGAALASVLGMTVSFGIMLTHCFSKKNRLRFTRPKQLGRSLKMVIATGLSSFINELSNGVIVCLFNIQVLRYAGEMTLSVYGIISNCAILFSSLFCGVGQAIQPLVSTNFGAKKMGRIKNFVKYGYGTILIMGTVLAALGIFMPGAVVRVFVNPTAEIMSIANTAIPIYFTAVLFMAINLFTTYYLQSITEAGSALIISMLRSIILSCSLVFIMPHFFGVMGLWFVIPISELVTCIVSIVLMKKVKL